jgi:parallel beta-helix repeat protein
MPRRHLALAAALGSATLLIPASLASATTGAAPARCGSVVTSDLTLRADLRGCTGDGLVVGADGITIDLNGHTISGDGLFGNGRFDTGVLVEGRRHVEVTGGTVRGFDRGMAVIGSTDSRVSRVTLTGNALTGISVRGTTRSVLTRVTARGNTYVGIYLTDGSNDNRIEANSVSGNEQGITLDGADTNLVKDNRLSGNGDDMILTGNGNRVAGNSARDAVGCGPDCGGYGISLEGGSDNVISGNRVTHTVMDGIRVSSYIPDLPTHGNVVRGNLVRGAGVDGIAVATTGEADPPTGSVVDANTVIGSVGDGIHVAEPGAVVADNLAVHNARYGIEAVPGVIDGGRNRAAGNGLTPPCVNVRCT